MKWCIYPNRKFKYSRIEGAVRAAQEIMKGLKEGDVEFDNFLIAFKALLWFIPTLHSRPLDFYIDRRLERVTGRHREDRSNSTNSRQSSNLLAPLWFPANMITMGCLFRHDGTTTADAFKIVSRKFLPAAPLLQSIQKGLQIRGAINEDKFVRKIKISANTGPAADPEAQRLNRDGREHPDIPQHIAIIENLWDEDIASLGRNRAEVIIDNMMFKGFKDIEDPRSKRSWKLSFLPEATNSGERDDDKVYASFVAPDFIELKNADDFNEEDDMILALADRPLSQTLTHSLMAIISMWATNVYSCFPKEQSKPPHKKYYATYVGDEDER